MVIAAFFTGCLSAQAGSRFSINPIFNFQYNPKRKVLPIIQMWISRFKSGKWLVQGQSPMGLCPIQVDVSLLRRVAKPMPTLESPNHGALP